MQELRYGHAAQLHRGLGHGVDRTGHTQDGAIYLDPGRALHGAQLVFDDRAIWPLSQHAQHDMSHFQEQDIGGRLRAAQQHCPGRNLFDRAFRQQGLNV